MIKNYKKYGHKFLSLFNVDLIQTGTLERLLENEIYAREMKFILNYPLENASKYLHFKNFSKAQLKQDLFVLSVLNFKRDGYFVEFGATDGVSLSNTFLLEKEFDWKGILAEPAKCWHDSLFQNRNVHIDKRCIFSSTGGEVIFNEVEKSALSTIEIFGKVDGHRGARKKGKQYHVKTISLENLLEEYGAPEIIDYLSIDTEGSEYEILKNFNFEKYKFRVLTVEHNFTKMRKEIFSLLSSHGYQRIHQEYSLFDDWYILS